MIIKKREFNELSLDELYSILKIRQEVFIVEQKCFYLDLDGLDQKGIHLLGFRDKELVAYMRILKPNKNSGDIDARQSIVLGRILVHKKCRNFGLGFTLMTEAINFLTKKFPFSLLEMSAQIYLIDFYRKFNFETYGDEYMDAGIPHIKMIKTS